MKIKELTIEQLSLYLPYGLRMFGCQSKMNCYILDKFIDDDFEIVPILRPKSDIENYKNEILIRWGGGLSEKGKEIWLNGIIDEMKYSAYNSLSYGFIHFMAEYHIDVFGLIEQGLAVNYNEIKGEI